MVANYLAAYALGFVSAGFVLVFCLWLSGKYNKLQGSLIEDLRAQLKETTNKMMAVDYQRLAEIDMQAKSAGMEFVYNQGDLYQTPDLSDIDVFDLEHYKITTKDETNA
jgi:hypothetical protein